MLTKNINLKNFKQKKTNKKILNSLKKIVKEKNSIIQSFENSYTDSFIKKNISKLKKFSNIIIIGMGGSILGAKTIYQFLKHKIKKNFLFIDNLDSKESQLSNKKKCLYLIVSKSGNTLETISNANVFLSKKQKSVFITENKKNYLTTLSKKLKSDIIHHNNYIGGRYSVLSEVGMLPAELMGLSAKKFRKFNQLIKNKKFVNSLILNVSNTLDLIKQKKFNSIILNYDEQSENLFDWYQQLIAESLGKKGKGILPIISRMPKDNHSVMQLYLDGPKSNFYTFFFVQDETSKKINNNKLLNTYSFLRTFALTKQNYYLF